MTLKDAVEISVLSFLIVAASALIWAGVVLVAIAVSGAVHAQPVSEHNEQQAALGRAYDLMFEAGCVRPDHGRTDRFRLEQEGVKYHVIGNRITITCSQWAAVAIAVMHWTAPTLREDGTSLDNIARYEIQYDDTLLAVGPDATSFTINDVPKGEHTFAVRTVDTNGRMSVFTTPVTVIVN